MQLYVDMDGVLADFDSGYESAFGVRPSKERDDVLWDLVKSRENFYRDLPPMPDMQILWEFVAPFKPIILTGVPFYRVPEAAENKRAWARKHLGQDVTVHCCRSSQKCEYALPGDILVDDWEKYRHLWIGKGGLWVTHYTAMRSIDQLMALIGRLEHGMAEKDG